MYSYPQYAANTTVAMPKPGKLPLNRLNRVKGPVYRHASLFPEGQQTIPYISIFNEYLQLTLAPMGRLQESQPLLRMLLDRSL
jgi:hypothetical protein